MSFPSLSAVARANSVIICRFQQWKCTVEAASFTLSAQQGHHWVATSLSPLPCCHLLLLFHPETKTKAAPRPSPTPLHWLPSLPRSEERDRWLCSRPKGDQPPLVHRFRSWQRLLLHQRPRPGKGPVWQGGVQREESSTVYRGVWYAESFYAIGLACFYDDNNYNDYEVDRPTQPIRIWIFSTSTFETPTM